MSRWSIFALALVALMCKDPYDFEPNDPTKPDPPGPPALVAPADGETIWNYAYPQDVIFEWQALSGTSYYQFELYSDSSLSPNNLLSSNPKVLDNTLFITFDHYGHYYWRVRAASRNWNNYTDWSAPFDFFLPNPTQ